MSDCRATPILAVQGATTDAIQSLLMAFAMRWRASGVRIVGAVEEPSPVSECAVLRDLGSGRIYSVHQDLGAGSKACRLDGSGVAEACEAIRRQIQTGCDLVILSKFGKLEAGRSGLVAAFTAAVEARIPILTAVSPSYSSSWHTFAGELATVAPANAEALDAWWQTLLNDCHRERSDARPLWSLCPGSSEA
ncbi:DUF2478 domain-containing protein [Methylobacterium sp. E-045]|uniref:DUF2478 domain-containing protein n=1 Tax=Methylobacterium sp. E-045 TaxID=2836575 RepID=UPI001FB8C270|nr:DUF2478 domain-containing protein [Methylobacterium sp. E-045]MCJ2131160.1 DUF2478 domain-containing protein [Methylobacterium sp. E-045]